MFACCLALANWPDIDPLLIQMKPVDADHQYLITLFNVWLSDHRNWAPLRLIKAQFYSFLYVIVVNFGICICHHSNNSECFLPKRRVALGRGKVSRMRCSHLAAGNHNITKAVGRCNSNTTTSLQPEAIGGIFGFSLCVLAIEIDDTKEMLCVFLRLFNNPN